jgi:hypothetical protein
VRVCGQLRPGIGAELLERGNQVLDVSWQVDPVDDEEMPADDRPP